jgi:hypothetical protein
MMQHPFMKKRCDAAAFLQIVVKAKKLIAED